PLLALIPDGEPVKVGLDLGLSAPVLSFTAATTLAVAVLLGLVPAWRGSRADVQRGLGATARSVTAGRSRRLVTRVLLTSQVAFSLVLLAAAGLLAASLLRLRAADKGFEEEHVLLVALKPRLAGMTA